MLLLVVLGLIELIGRPPGPARRWRASRDQAIARPGAGGPPPAPRPRLGRPVLVQAAGLALLAALSPTALLVAAVYLGSARPRLTATFYLIGRGGHEPGHGRGGSGRAAQPPT